MHFRCRIDQFNKNGLIWVEHVFPPTAFLVTTQHRRSKLRTWTSEGTARRKEETPLILEDDTKVTIHLLRRVPAIDRSTMKMRQLLENRLKHRLRMFIQVEELGERMRNESSCHEFKNNATAHAQSKRPTFWMRM